MKSDTVIAIIERERMRAQAFLGQGAFLCPEESAQTTLLPVLHALQEEFGSIEADVLPIVAEELNISQAELRGVVSFYHDFRLEPAGRRTLKLCRAEACQSMGCETLSAHLRQRHGLTPGQTTRDGALTLEDVYCLGNCALAPAALLDGELIGRINQQRLDAIVAGARK